MNTIQKQVLKSAQLRILNDPDIAELSDQATELINEIFDNSISVNEISKDDKYTKLFVYKFILFSLECPSGSYCDYVACHVLAAFKHLQIKVNSKIIDTLSKNIEQNALSYDREFDELQEVGINLN